MRVSPLRLLLAGAIAAAGLGIGAAPASAVCYDWLRELAGYCSPCSIVGGPYNVADRTLHDALPPIECVA